jgi:hypothetical protein
MHVRTKVEIDFEAGERAELAELREACPAVLHWSDEPLGARAILLLEPDVMLPELRSILLDLARRALEVERRCLLEQEEL